VDRRVIADTVGGLTLRLHHEDRQNLGEARERAFIVP
jgi:hypothetical protein